MQQVITKYATARVPPECIPPSKFELILIAKEMGVVMNLTSAAEAIFNA